MAKFCPKCGAKVHEDAAEIVGSQITNGGTKSDSPQHNMKKFIIGVLLVVIVVGAGAGAGIAQANEILKSKGYSYTVGSVSPVNNIGFLGLITDKGREFVV